MISISTIGDLLKYGYGLNGWCETCSTWRPVDLDALAAHYGLDATTIKPQSPIWLRCRDCGNLGNYQLATPCAYEPGGR